MGGGGGSLTLGGGTGMGGTGLILMGGGLGTGFSGGGGGGRVRTATSLATAGLSLMTIPKMTTRAARVTLITMEATVALLLRWPSLRTPKSRNWTLGGLGSSLRSGLAILDFGPQTCTNRGAGVALMEKSIQSIAEEFR